MTLEQLPQVDANDEILALIETLLASERRLEELTGGEVDTVAGRDGRTFLLRRAQEQLRYSEAGKQAAILNALPAHIALLDTQGVIISVNESWRRFADANTLHFPGHGVGLNYIDICDRARGAYSSEAHQVAAGIRAVLGREAKSFSLEYPCHSPTEQRWFLLTVTPLADDRPNGAVVMHLNITARKLAAEALEELSQQTERRERILNSALSSMSDFAQIYNRDGRLLFVNQPLLNLWGLTLEAVVGKNFLELGYPDELAAKLQRQVQEVLETKRTITDETVYFSPAGMKGWYEYIFSPVLASDGTVEFVVGSTRVITGRKRAEEALRGSEERLRAALSASGTGTFRWDIGTGELSWDESLHALFGIPNGQAIHSLDSFIATVHPIDRPGVIERCDRCAREGVDFDMEFRVIWPDGSLHWLHDRGRTFLDAAGRALYMTGACADITQRKRAEEASRQSEEKFREVADNITDVFWMMSHDMHEMLYVSKAYETVWGFSMQSLYADPHQWVNAVVPEDRGAVLAAFAGLTKDLPSVNVEYRIMRPDGKVRWIQDRGFQVRDATGRLVRNAGLATDITEQKRGSALLMKSERRLALATESAGIGIWDWDMVTNQLIWDEQMYALYGIREQDFSGAYDAWQKGLHPEDRQQAEADLNTAAHSADGFHLEFRVLWPNGEVHHIEAHALVQRAGDSSTAHMIGVNWDITERRQAEESRKRAEIRVEALHKQLLDASRRAGMAEVATGVLHNVGNVLNSVNVSTSLVVERLQNSSVSRLTEVVQVMSDHAADLAAFLTLDERGRKVPSFLAQLAVHLNRETQQITEEMQAVAENVDHIKEIVNTQQAYAGTFGVLEPLDLRESIDDALRIHAGALNRHNIEIVRNLEPVAEVVVDKHKVLQILVNLIGNAKQAMTDSPVKTLTIKTYSSSDGGSQLSIGDTGCGILAENITRIFAHGFTTKKDGHGFGLHSSALAARQMNAALIAHSDGAGRGSVFSLVFPPALPSPRPDDGAFAPALARGG